LVQRWGRGDEIAAQPALDITKGQTIFSSSSPYGDGLSRVGDVEDEVASAQAHDLIGGRGAAEGKRAVFCAQRAWVVELYPIEEDLVYRRFGIADGLQSSATSRPFTRRRT
jgi:hypothetical protein